jgi:hypothetical protein
MAVTVGLVAAEIMGYIVLVKKFPILRGAPGAGPHAGGTDHAHAPVSPAPALAGAVVLLALLFGTVASLNAQTRPRGEDLRCLSPNNPEHCLPEPLPLDEPHDAICATCHNLATQRTFAEAAKTCTAAGCHTNVEQLTPYHRGLRPATLQNCIGCHPAHDARIRKGGAECSFCHDVGGVLPTVEKKIARDVGRPVAPNVVFRHARHNAVECKSCHVSDQRHGATTVRRLQDCRSCHHTEAKAANCLSCHRVEELRAVNSTVQRTFDIQVGSIDRPTRTLPFEHAAHITADCRTCHTGGTAMVPSQAGCVGCHEQHHRPTANCRTCHETPKQGVHDREVHLGCGGVGCHEAATATILEAPRTRPLCITCHIDRGTNHRIGNCADCHILPKPKAARR